MDEKGWHGALVKGALAPALLAALGSRPRHGYDLMQVLEQHGFGQLRGGTVYPLLRRLEERGLVVATWDTSRPGAARRTYRLTREGSSSLGSALEEWKQIGARLEALRDEGSDR